MSRLREAWVPRRVLLSAQTSSNYRKLHKYADQLDDYKAKAEAAGDDVELTISGFIDFVGAGATIATKYGGKTDWFTPSKYVEKARAAMGSIDVDPASSRHAQKIVKAGQFFTEADSGLEYEWHGNVFLNPPYAAVIKAFVKKLIDEIVERHTKQAVLLETTSDMHRI